ncbi:hypothetical protein EV426DRAFT_721011 [Tirmania nivea]|nr:hypothetical protein EV426DRAFT_721011 [Tirmania nivea]
MARGPTPGRNWKLVLRKARRGYDRVKEEGALASERVSREMKKLTEMVTILAALNGVGTPEDCEKARRLQCHGSYRRHLILFVVVIRQANTESSHARYIQARRQAQVAEAKRASAEVKKIAAREKEDLALKKKAEEAKEAA